MQTIVNPLSLKEHLSRGKETVVLFVFSTCPFCKAFRPRFEAFAARGAAAREHLTVVLDDFGNPLWDAYGIDVVPTVIVFAGDAVKARRDGRAGVGLTEKDLESL
ncbi:MAG: thioredoxin domain-containing protein [Chlamydiota bacterium]